MPAGIVARLLQFRRSEELRRRGRSDRRKDRAQKQERGKVSPVKGGASDNDQQQTARDQKAEGSILDTSSMLSK
ncbi:MAG: hypothetical protein CME19_15060 [Gemmatimonadetes bacterium]|nr:hypothetical protein [Gemmatimonadota bacterium]